jgi:hypothetical protein
VKLACLSEVDRERPSGSLRLRGPREARRSASDPSVVAVEFDGARTHVNVESRRRDLRKNRLCAASGLPLVRVDDRFLHRRERLSVVEWLAGLWAAHRSEMPGLLVERDAEIEAMSEEELEAAGLWLLGERPDLDVDLVFRLEHPFPPVRRLAERLAVTYGFQWSEVNAFVRPATPRWRVASWLPALPSRTTGLVDHWRCKLWLAGPGAQTAEVQGLADVQPVPTARGRDRGRVLPTGESHREN